MPGHISCLSLWLAVPEMEGEWSGFRPSKMRESKGDLF